MPRGRMYKVPHRRRREGKTDYRLRLRLLMSGKPRFVVRKSSNNITCQIMQHNPTGDVTIVHADSRELAKLGWKSHGGNLPSAYLTGLLCALRAKKKKIPGAVLDMGLYRSTKGSRLYAALRGALDGNMNIPHSPDILPPDDRIKGKHTKSIAEKDFEAVKKKIMNEQ